MSGPALILVVAAAALHATWNALAKAGRDKLAFLWIAVALGSLLVLPWSLWEIRATGFPPGALPFVVGTSVLHAVYFYTLGRAYRSGEFSIVYPVARGLGVALVPVVALPLFGERLSALGVAGIALVIAGIVALNLPAMLWERGVPRARHRLAGTAWAVLTGLVIASYSLLDKAGVARLHPAAYVGLMGVGSVCLLLPAVGPGALRAEWRVNRRAILLVSTMDLTAYLLVLFAFQVAKTGYVVAARELSIVLSALIGSLWFGEGRVGPRLLGAAVVLAGVACVALAR
jgi:drug/metabolite transporter (DMT)-like permease